MECAWATAQPPRAQAYWQTGASKHFWRIRWAKISKEDLETINNIISNKIYNEQSEEKPYFYGKVIETTANYIIVEPNEDEEERNSADKISVGLGEYNDALYMVGTNVKITYDGNIMESYPAQINIVKISVLPKLIYRLNAIPIKISMSSSQTLKKNP